MRFFAGLWLLCFTQAYANTCDTRELVAHNQDPQVQLWAQSIAALVIEFNPRPERLTLPTELSQMKGKNYCPSDHSMRFPKQLKVVCTGTLIAPDVVLTAAHCVEEKCEPEHTWVFSYIKNRKVIPKEDVYRCRKILRHQYLSKPSWPLLSRYTDYALVQLDRPVQGRRPLPLGNPEAGAEVIGLGFPLSSPMTVSMARIDKVFNQTVRSNIPNLPGSSGGPLLDKRSGKIVGIASTLNKVDTLLQSTQEEGHRCHRLNFCNYEAVHTNSRIIHFKN